MISPGVTADLDPPVHIQNYKNFIIQIPIPNSNSNSNSNSQFPIIQWKILKLSVTVCSEFLILQQFILLHTEAFLPSFSS